jgi:hypothetical protein
MGNGAVMSRAASAAISDAPTPKSAKVLSVLMFGVFQHQSGEIAGGQYRSPRYEVRWCANHLGMKKRFTTCWPSR